MARPHPVLLDLAKGRRPDASADPSGLVESALDHRMGGLLWEAVRAGQVLVPPAAAQQLARVHLWTQGHHRKLWRAAEVITARLAAIDAGVVLFKGVTAERRWYGREGARPCNDLDALLHPVDVARIHDIIDALAPEHPLDPAVVDLLRTGVLPSLDLRVAGIDLDLHRDPLKIEIPTRCRPVYWERSEPMVTDAGHTVRVFDTETSLVQLLLHLNKDRFSRLIGFVDVARILQGRVDWPVVAELLAAEGMTQAGVAALERVTDTLDLPAAPLARPGGWRAAAWDRLWPDAAKLGGRGGLVTLQHRQLWLPWLAEGRVHEALWWWLRRRAFPPRPLLTYQLPDTRGPYLWRLVAGRIRRFLERRTEARAAG